MCTTFSTLTPHGVASSMPIDVRNFFFFGERIIFDSLRCRAVKHQQQATALDSLALQGPIDVGGRIVSYTSEN
jgi:hypothetical protein